MSGAGDRYDARLTWLRRGEALLAVVLLVGAAGSVTRAARLVGAPLREYRRWLATARAWLAHALRYDALRDEVVARGTAPTVPRDEVARARLLAFLDATRISS